MLNALSFDIEDWFQVYNFNKIIKYQDWDKQESRIKANTHKILDILSKHDTKATFFILGWIADRFPKIVKAIDNLGHEIATHGYSHRLIYHLTPKQFNKELKDSIKAIKKSTKQQILGYRAPSFSITNKTLWALSILKKNGIKYDSSIFPITHPDYGIKNSKTIPYEITKGLIEFPLSTIKLFEKNIPLAGGGYFRVFPYPIIKFGIKKLNKRNIPAIVYLHPWEFDPDQPKLKISFFKKFRHYTNLHKTEKKIKKLLKDFRFAPVKEILKLDKNVKRN